MAINEGKHSDFSRGVANTLPADLTPEGYVRDALNLEPQGSDLSLRAGYEQLVSGDNVRGVAALDSHLLFADGPELKRYDLNTGVTDVLDTGLKTGAFAATEFNNELFLCIGKRTLRYDGRELREWGVPEVLSQPSVSVSGEDTGDRQVAMTWVNDHSEEGGTVRPEVVPGGNRFEFTIPERPGFTARLYVSPPNANTLYWQADFAPGADPAVVTNPRDDTAPLETVGMRRPPYGHLLAAKDAVVCVAQDRYVFFMEPFKPHLRDIRQNFLQYPEEVGMLLDGQAGLFVSADECYVVTGVESSQVEQSGVLNYPAVRGTGTTTEDGRAAWVTQHGLAIESGQGVEEPNKGTFSPRPAEEGTMGYVNNGGRQMLVASMKGRQGGTGQLAAGDYFEAEVVKK